MTITLEGISKLQTQEQELIEELTKLINANAPASTTEPIIKQINRLSDARIAMFSSLSEKAEILQSSTSNSRADLVSQMTLLNVVESQLKNAKSAISTLQNKNDTKLRMVQINTYYGQRYEAQSSLMKLIIMVCIPVLILFILKKKGLLPDMIASYAIGITIAVSAIFVIRKVWNISMRSNMNYDEIDWKFEDPSDYAPSIWEYNKKHFFNFDNPLKNVMSKLGLCISEQCCADGLYFDTVKQKCLNVEKFSTLKYGNNLNGTAVATFDNDPTMGGVAPFSSSFDYASI